MANLLNLLCRLAGFEPFDVQKHGRIAPAAWHGSPAPAKEKPRQTDGEKFKPVAVNNEGDVAYSKTLKLVEGKTFEAPVKNTASDDEDGRIIDITYLDTVELSKRLVSLKSAEKIKPLWVEGFTAKIIAQRTGLSVSTCEKAIGAFNAAHLQTLANASATN